MYTKGNITLLNMDCMEYMASLPDKSFDLALTDPPYGVGFKYNSYDDGGGDGYYDWCDEWFNELARISRCQVLTVGYKNNEYWYRKKPKHVIQWIKKNQCSPSPIGGFSCYESVFIFGKNKKRIGQDVMEFPVKTQSKADFHPCPKEAVFWTALADKFVDKGDSIIDIFFGSGTGAISAHILGCEFVGTEIDVDYYTAAVERFENETKQVALI